MYASWFVTFNSGFILKECNRVADYLAHIAISGEIGIWLEDPFDELTHLLTDDFGF